MVVVPVLIPVTKPEVLIVAMVVAEDDHVAPAAGVPEPVNWLVAVLQTVVVPLIAGTFTVAVTVVLLPQKLVYVIVLVPAVTPVTKPVLLTVAIVMAEDVHGLEVAGVPEPESWKVPVLQIIGVPVIIGAEVAFTVNTAVVLQFPPSPEVYVIVVVPALTPVTVPFTATVAMVVADELHVGVPVGVPEPLNWVEFVPQTDSVPEIEGKSTVTVAVVLQPPPLAV